MRTNNGKVKNVIISLYFILIVMAIVMTTLISEFRDIADNPTRSFFIIFIAFLLLFGITHRISKYFEYDSDGMKVVILNRGLLLSDYFNYREHKLEFEKSELTGFRFYNYIFFKNLVIHIKTKKGHKRTERFNVTLVSRKKRKYIKQSLSKMIKQNKKLNIQS